MFRQLNIFAITILIHFMVSALPSVYAHEHKPTEHIVKTAYIYNFAKLVEWPVSLFTTSETPIILGILGDDPMTKSLKTLKGKSVKGRPISIKQILSTTEITRCHILYIAANQANSLKTILPTVRYTPCLTVSNIEGFARQGGMINFIPVNNKIRFEINLGATRTANLKISSRLLKVATIVGMGPEGGRQ